MLYVYINQTCSRKRSYLRTINAAVVLKCDWESKILLLRPYL